MPLDRLLSLLMLFAWLITISTIEFFQGGIEAVKAGLPFGLIMVLPVTIIWRGEWIADRPQYNNIRSEASAVLLKFTAWLVAIYLVAMYPRLGNIG